MLIKQKSPPRIHLALKTLGKLLTVFLIQANLLYLLYSTTQRCSLMHLINQNWLLKTFLRTLILMTQISFYLFSLPQLIWNCIIFLKLPRLLKKVITNLDSSMAFGLHCIPVVLLKNCEPELSYILAELFNMCLKESFFQIARRSQRWFM